MAEEPSLHRRDFLWKLAALSAGVPLLAAPGRLAAGAVVGEEEPEQVPLPRRSRTGDPELMPLLFVGHGSPMNAIEDNTWSRGFRALAALVPRPRVVLAVSAHWYVPGTYLTGNERPETIHDFGGFPAALYEMQYPAPGDVELARKVVRLLGEDRASLRDEWGLDHGTWSVLHHLIPMADCPVVQLSLDQRLSPSGHLELGRSLAALRREGVLILGSGNITHNLRHAFASQSRREFETPAWASEFDAEVTLALEQHDGDYLARVVESESGRMSHPTLDHYLPLLYVAGASRREDTVCFPITGFDMASLSMRAALLGAPAEPDGRSPAGVATDPSRRS